MQVLIDAAGEDLPGAVELASTVQAMQGVRSIYGNIRAHLGSDGRVHPTISARQASGRLSITDRLKDVIKTGGEWISSLDMENILSRHPQVAEVAVIGVPHPQWGESALPFIVSRTGEDIPLAELAELIDACIADGSLPSYAKLKEVRFVSEIPKTSVGKLDKKALRQMAG